MSLLGLVRHMADVERNWFRRVMARADAPPLYWPDAVCSAMQDGTTVALREVILHMVEEYARHLGHADLLRERIDGRVGQ